MPRRIALLVVCLALAANIAAAQGSKRPITEKDLFQFNWVGDPQVSPDGAQVAFVRVNVGKDRKEYETSLWTVPTAGGDPQRLTNGPRDASPRWSPDGKRLAFVRTPAPAPGASGEGAAPQGPQLWILSFSGGEPFQATTLARGVSSVSWSPDGKHIAFLNSALPEDLKPEAEKARNKPEHESDVRVINRAVYRFNGGGYLDTRHQPHVWVMEVPGNSEQKVQPQQLTKGLFDDRDPQWTPDGSRLIYATTRIVETYYELPQSDIYSVSVSGGEPQKIVHIDGQVGGLSLSPDGSRLAYVGTEQKPINSYTESDLYVIDLKSGAMPKNLTRDFDYDIGGGLTGDQRAPRGGGGSRVLWTTDGKTLVTAFGKEGRENLAEVDAGTGKLTELTRGDHEVENYSAALSRMTGKLALVIATPTEIGNLWFMDSPGTQPRRLTNVNEKLWSELNITPPEEIWYSSFDGKKIHAWIQKPPDFNPSKKYPFILQIHGGPHAAHGYTFFHEVQYMAAKGYVVLYPNPRGSTTYGQEFGNIIQYKYPGDDAKDLLAGVDEVLKRGYVDEKKLGVTGGSGGGVLTNWIVGHSDRFAAAVSQRSIADWAAWWYIDDFTLFEPSWFKGPPWEQREDFQARSPLTYIANVKTPLMLIEGEADYRTPNASGGEEMFRALKYRKIPTVMVRFPSESHELSRSGQPWHRIERLEHIVNWFDKYLKGERMAQYDIPSADQAPASAE